MDHNLDKNRSGIIRRKWTLAEEAELLELKAKGETDRYLAWRYGTTPAAVSNKYERLMVKQRDAELTRKAYAGKPRNSGERIPRKITQPYQRNAARWSPEDCASLVADVDAADGHAIGDKFAAAAQKLNRTRWACKIQYDALKRGYSTRGVPVSGEVPSKRTTRRSAADLAATARARTANSSHDSLTAAFCGDPLPERSALYKRNMGIVDEPDPAEDKGIRPNPITLATRPFRLYLEEVEA